MKAYLNLTLRRLNNEVKEVGKKEIRSSTPNPEQRGHGGIIQFKERGRNEKDVVGGIGCGRLGCRSCYPGLS